MLRYVFSAGSFSSTQKPMAPVVDRRAGRAPQFLSLQPSPSCAPVAAGRAKGRAFGTTSSSTSSTCGGPRGRSPRTGSFLLCPEDTQEEGWTWSLKQPWKKRQQLFSVAWGSCSIHRSSPCWWLAGVKSKLVYFHTVYQQRRGPNLPVYLPIANGYQTGIGSKQNLDDTTPWCDHALGTQSLNMSGRFHPSPGPRSSPVKPVNPFRLPNQESLYLGRNMEEYQDPPRSALSGSLYIVG